MIYNYNDFVSELLKSGFSMGGGNDEGVFALISWSWNEAPPYDTPVRWHTGDFDTDPWEWRMRILEERNDVAYAKLFFKKSGYITKEWYPYFLAARRGSGTFAEDYSDGKISRCAKRIYDVVYENGALPLHAIKQLAGFSAEDKGKFDGALCELQMKMHLTMCGRKQKASKTGEEYGWHSTVFCTADDFFGAEVFDRAANIRAADATDKIMEQILKLNSFAETKQILKFIKG